MPPLMAIRVRRSVNSRPSRMKGRLGPQTEKSNSPISPALLISPGTRLRASIQAMPRLAVKAQMK
jgi:hypothetical protein